MSRISNESEEDPFSQPLYSFTSPIQIRSGGGYFSYTGILFSLDRCLLMGDPDVTDL